MQYYITKSTSYDISGKLIYQKIGMHNRSGSIKTGKQRAKSLIRTKFKQRHIGNSQSLCGYNMH